MQQRPMKANEIVALFARLLGIDVTLIASVIGNIPRANLQAWLGGKKDNLRHDSVVRVLELLGLRIRNGLRLDATRVHIWQLKDGLFSRNAYEPFRSIARLMEGCAITRVEPPKRGLFARNRHQVYLISGPVGGGGGTFGAKPQVRVIVHLKKSLFKRARLGPETIPGALWRDMGAIAAHLPVHTIPVVKGKWDLIMSRDIAPHEFDQVFEMAEPKVAWNDVAMLAREYGVTPDMTHHMILERFGRPASAAQNASTGNDDERGTLPVNVTLLPHYHDRAA